MICSARFPIRVSNCSRRLGKSHVIQDHRHFHQEDFRSTKSFQGNFQASSSSFATCPTSSNRRRLVLRQVGDAQSCDSDCCSAHTILCRHDRKERSRDEWRAFRDCSSQRAGAYKCVVSTVAISAYSNKGFQKTNEKCFAKCIAKPGTSLSSSEEAGAPTEFTRKMLTFSHIQTCLSRCLERYLETCESLAKVSCHAAAHSLAVNMISKTYSARLSREREQRQLNQI